MIPGKWYNIKDDEQLKEFERIIKFHTGYPVFDLSLSDDFTKVKKTLY